VRLVAVLFALLFTAISTFADPVEEVRQAEIAFAKAFADRDAAKFFAFVADDATFLSGLRTATGKKQVVESWTRYFNGPAPFVWGPDRVSLSADGTLGLSTGPVYVQGQHVGDYISTWRKTDGAWKIVFDSNGPGAAPLAENAAPHEEGFVPTPDGVKLHYRKIGNGPITMIVPLGLVLYDAMKQFADIATVITYDLRSRGRSTRAQDVNTLTIEYDVKDLETVRAHFKVEQFVPLGYSYLGKMVVMYAAAHPDRVRRIVQMGPVANREEPRVPKQVVEDFGAPREDVQRWQKLRAEGAAEKTPREFCLAQWQVLRYYMVGDPKNAPGVKIDEMCGLENEWPVNFFMPNFTKSLTDEELKKVTMPSLIIHGTKDRNASYEGGRSWLTALPDARIVTIPGAAHAMWVDDPVTTFAAIRHFLRGEWPLGSVPSPASRGEGQGEGRELRKIRPSP
jgi:pimeloyl-ACP methyl ester carboxylesterase/ketosteroid isomerase-like protein